MGSHGQRAVPALGPMIERALTRIVNSLTPSASPECIGDARRMVETELSQWADKAQENQTLGDQTIRDLLLLVCETSKSTGTRDEKFSKEVSVLSDRLRSVAGLESLSVIRRSILENTSSLNSSVARMSEESREAIRKLASEVAEYQTRLVASERRALVDPLTGLGNRRSFEQQLEIRVKLRQPFSLLVADLNEFKAINDRHGHVVGDEILKHFADEFRRQFGPNDTVARWGGDEFVAIVPGPPAEGEQRADRVRHGAFGECKTKVDAKTITVNVDAAIGIMPWNGAESALEIFTRADREMYRAKQSRWRSAKPLAGQASPPVIAGRSSTESAAKSPIARARLGGQSLVSASTAESSAPWKRS
jgi:diguanylate cyclase (GGDEF)-like protein